MAFREQIGGTAALRAFDSVSARQLTLASFATPTALLEFLTNPAGDLDHKDQIIATLVAMVQSSDEPELAWTLLWLGLWPGLDAIFLRRSRFSSVDRDELASVIAVAFTTLVGHVDLRNLTRVAATLVRSTDRELLAARRQTRPPHKWQPLLLPHSTAPRGSLDDDDGDSAIEVLPTSPPQRCRASELLELRRWLLPVVGAEADLLLAVIVLGETPRQAAHRFQVTHEAVRKRVQRAKARVRTFLESQVSPFSPSGGLCLRDEHEDQGA